jgi:HPt (histidine-containing phosphotransfer) domain-containing protein
MSQPLASNGTVLWDEAMKQVQGDIESLQEIMVALIDELTGIIHVMHQCIKGRDFAALIKAAHVTHGSCSYVFCHDLMLSAKGIEQLANEGLIATDGNAQGIKTWNGSPSREVRNIWLDLEKAYKNHVSLTESFRIEFETHFSHSL